MEEEDFVFWGDEDDTGSCQSGYKMAGLRRALTYLELGRGTANSFFLDFVDIADSDRLRDELWFAIAEYDR